MNLLSHICPCLLKYGQQNTNCRIKIANGMAKHRETAGRKDRIICLATLHNIFENTITVSVVCLIKLCFDFKPNKQLTLRQTKQQTEKKTLKNRSKVSPTVQTDENAAYGRKRFTHNHRSLQKSYTRWRHKRVMKETA